jgi:isopentenyl diphosphate isomerase/L-lactate dehydrogenase-like FMN-dependent dehydrogenase
MPRMMFDYIDGAAGNEVGERLNRSEIERIRLQPRVLVNVEDRSLGKRFMGRNMGLPFGIAPMGMCDLTWPGADQMLAAEAVRRGIPLCLSTAASTTLEDMHALTNGRAWFQLYVSQSLESAMQMVDRATGTGYEVLVLTVDVPQVSRRIRDLRNGFQMPFRMGPKQFLDFACHPQWSVETLLHGAPKPVNFETAAGGQGFMRHASRGSTDWSLLDRLRSRWKGKLIVKGVLSPADAVRIRDAGADAVYVSNHGGRQLDSAPAAIQALPLIREAVGDDYLLIFDSGVRSGEDIVNALALGADFVMLGRPLMYAIGADGARGLSTLFDILAEEISVTLAQIGRRRVEDVDSSVLLVPPSGVAPETVHETALPVLADDSLEG